MGATIAKERLYSSIEASNERDIRKIIEKFPKILNQVLTSDCKSTALGRAAFRGDLRITEVLIELGADVNFSGPKGITPLMWAIRRGQYIVAKYLVENGADTSIIDPDGCNILENSIVYGQYDVGLYLIEKFPELKESIRSENDYQVYKDIADSKYYKYVDYKNFVEHLQNKIPFDACPSFYTKPRPPPLIDPVIDPRETWGQWFKRVVDFKDAPMVERGDLPEHLQPQNRTMGKLASYLNGQSPYPDNYYETQATSLKESQTSLKSHKQQSNKELISNRDDIKNNENINIQLNDNDNIENKKNKVDVKSIQLQEQNQLQDGEEEIKFE